MPILKKIIHIPVKVPGADGLRSHYREMLTVAGIDRPLVFSRYGADGVSYYDTSLVEKFSLHDLRRSFATTMVYVLKVEKERIKMITGHTTDASFEKYLFPSAEYLSAKSLTEEWQNDRRKFLLGA